MHSLIVQNLEKIAELCRRCRVSRLHLIGSATDGTFDPARSDVDFLVEFLPGTTGGFDHPYFELRDGLVSVLGREVDLVMRSAVENPIVLRSMQASKVQVYAAA